MRGSLFCLRRVGSTAVFTAGPAVASSGCACCRPSLGTALVAARANLAAGRWPQPKRKSATGLQTRHGRAARRRWTESGRFFVFLLAIYYFHLECLGGQYAIDKILT